MEKTTTLTSKPVVAGVFNIISGVLSLGGFIAFLIAGIAVSANFVSIHIGASAVGIASGVLIAFALLSLVIGILAIVGGIYALQRSKWGLAFTGSICALVPSFVLGLVAIILVATSRDEFA
jgi:hypothetical protein